jgi:hypothetical protein
LHNTLVVLVRATDKLPAGTNPMQYFKGKVLGAPQGNSFIQRLRDAGLTIDDGGRDLDRNIEKLKLGRIDGVVVASVSPAHVKATLDKYKGTVAQLPLPLVQYPPLAGLQRHFLPRAPRAGRSVVDLAGYQPWPARLRHAKIPQGGLSFRQSAGLRNLRPSFIASC